MSLVKQRKLHHRALRLSLPPQPKPSPHFWYRRHEYPTSPDIQNLTDLEKLGVLGHGNGSTVYKVRHRRTLSIFALKILRSDNSAATASEAEILKRVDSPFIVKCLTVLDSIGGEICFVMEHMERGSLYDELCLGEVLPEEAIAAVAANVLRGLNYLHGLGIVHGDIKPSNLLIDQNGCVKIADFGASKIVSGTCDADRTCNGTCAYMSPERIDPARWDGDTADGFSGDVWSLGVVVLECLVGHYPLIGIGEKPVSPVWVALMCAICFEERVEMPESASPEIRSFLRRCLERDWRKRATVVELLGHPFIINGGGCRGEGVIGTK